MTSAQLRLMEKIEELPPLRLAEVEDFVDFLRSRSADHELSHAALRASEPSLASVWDNDGDAEYDKLQTGKRPDLSSPH